MEIKEIVKALDSYFMEKIKRLNLYIIPQFCLLVILYYLVFNSLINVIDTIAKTNKWGIYPVEQYFPEIIIEYNDLVMNTLLLWNPFVLILSLGLLMSAIVIQSTRNIIIFRNYKTFINHSSYGSDVFVWFFIMWVAIELYSFSKVWFPVFFFIFMIISIIKDKAVEKLEDLGITFN